MYSCTLTKSVLYVYSCTRTFKVVLYVIRKNPPKKRTRDEKHVQKCTREHPRAKPNSSARDARLRAKLCTITVLRHAHNATPGFFEFRARREEIADLARNRDSRRSRTPLATESMNAKSPA